MTYNPNIPNPGDLQSNSQGQIKTNFQTLNTSFGVDHYPFADVTAKNGFHNKVTTPLIAGATHPVTTTNPILYAMQDSANLGIIQYSRGPTNAVPTPVTFLQSPVTPIMLVPTTTTNVFDFSGLSQAFAILYAANLDASTSTRRRVETFVRWINNGTGTRLDLTDILDTTGQTLVATNTGNILQLQNTSGSTTLNDVFWTLQFIRIN